MGCVTVSVHSRTSNNEDDDDDDDDKLTPTSASAADTRSTLLDVLVTLYLRRTVDEAIK